MCATFCLHNVITEYLLMGTLWPNNQFFAYRSQILQLIANLIVHMSRPAI